MQVPYPRFISQILYKASMTLMDQLQYYYIWGYMGIQHKNKHFLKFSLKMRSQMKSVCVYFKCNFCGNIVPTGGVSNNFAKRIHCQHMFSYVSYAYFIICC